MSDELEEARKMIRKLVELHNAHDCDMGYGCRSCVAVDALLKSPDLATALGESGSITTDRTFIRPCKRCGYEHEYTSDVDDAEDCPRCSGELYPISHVKGSQPKAEHAEYVPTPKQDPATVNYHAMMGEKVVFHFAKDVDLVAWIERVYHPELVNLYVLSDGYLDVGAGAGNACSHTCVMLSPSVGGWSWPPVEP